MKALIPIVALGILAVGCGEMVVPTPTATPRPTATPTPTATATPRPTATPTPTATATPRPTATPTPDLRAACNKKMASVFRKILWWMGDGWMDTLGDGSRGASVGRASGASDGRGERTFGQVGNRRSRL